METTIKYAKEDIPRSIRNSDHLTGEIGFVVKERRAAYGKKTKEERKTMTNKTPHSFHFREHPR